VGAAIIVGSTLYIAYRETYLSRTHRAVLAVRPIAAHPEDADAPQPRSDASASDAVGPSSPPPLCRRAAPGVLARITAQEERIEVEGQEAGGVILATPLRILNPSIVSAGMEAISRGE